MSKTFDTINIHTLIRKLLQTNIPGTIIKLIENYIKRLKAHTTHNHTMSNWHSPHTQARVQPRNTYNHTYIKFLPGQNITNSPKTIQNCLHSVHSKPYGLYEQSGHQKNNTALPMATYPKVMGLTLDPKPTYSPLIHNILVHARTPLQIIKALIATGWRKRKQKETLMATYKAVMGQP